MHVDQSYHSGNEMVSSSLPEESIASPVPNTLMDSTADSSNIAESRSFISINEWKGFKIVGANIDKNVHPSFQRIHNRLSFFSLCICLVH